MLISLTVAAVSGGVHMRLDQVQKLDNLVETEIDLVDTISEDDETPMEEKEIEVRRTMRTHTFFGKGPEKVLNNEQSNASVNPSR